LIRPKRQVPKPCGGEPNDEYALPQGGAIKKNVRQEMVFGRGMLGEKETRCDLQGGDPKCVASGGRGNKGNTKVGGRRPVLDASHQGHKREKRHNSGDCFRMKIKKREDSEGEPKQANGERITKSIFF